MEASSAVLRENLAGWGEVRGRGAAGGERRQAVRSSRGAGRQGADGDEQCKHLLPTHLSPIQPSSPAPYPPVPEPAKFICLLPTCHLPSHTHLSPIQPKKSAPRGRVIKPAAKMPHTDRALVKGSLLGKKSLEMTTLWYAKHRKSYHSVAGAGRGRSCYKERSLGAVQGLGKKNFEWTMLW